MGGGWIAETRQVAGLCGWLWAGLGVGVCLTADLATLRAVVARTDGVDLIRLKAEVAIISNHPADQVSGSRRYPAPFRVFVCLDFIA